MKTALRLLLAGAILAPLAAQADIDAAALWKSHCQKCHAADGSASGPMGKRLGIKDYRDPAVQDAMTDEEILVATRDGVTKDGKEVMPGYSAKLSADEINTLLGFIRGMRKQ